MKLQQGRIHGNPVADGWAGAVMRKLLGIKQGRIHGRTVADSWAGAVKRKPPGIQQCDGRTDGWTDLPTDRHSKV